MPHTRMIQQYNTQTKHTDLSCLDIFLPEIERYGSLNYLGFRMSISASSLLSVSDEMNMPICGYSAKWWNSGGGGWCSTVDGNGCRLPKRSLEWHTPTSKTLPAITRQKQNYTNIVQSFKIYVHEIATDAPRLRAASGDCWNCTFPTSKTLLAMTR